MLNRRQMGVEKLRMSGGWMARKGPRRPGTGGGPLTLPLSLSRFSKFPLAFEIVIAIIATAVVRGWELLNRQPPVRLRLLGDSNTGDT